MKPGTCVVVIFFCLLSCKPSHESCEFEGTYDIDGDYYSSRLIIGLDHSFTIKTSHYNCFGGEKESLINGSFKTDGDRLFLSPSTFHIIQHQHDSTVDRKVYDSAQVLSTVSGKVHEYNDTLQVLRWNGRMFILGADGGAAAKMSLYGYSNDMTALLNIYNRDPDQINHYELQQRLLGGFWNKRCAKCNEKDLKKVLPPQWEDYILATPIKAEITKVEKANDRIVQYILEINAGALQNVRFGMRFYPQHSNWTSDAITITDVFENYSKGTITVGSRIKPDIGGAFTTLCPVKD